MTAAMPTDVLADAIARSVADQLRPDVTARLADLVIPAEHDVLSGAEQIAGHLGVTERFVRDHEHELPIRRVGTKLFASKAACTAWLRADR